MVLHRRGMHPDAGITRGTRKERRRFWRTLLESAGRDYPQ